MWRGVNYANLQRFLVVVAFWVLAILCIQGNINSQFVPPRSSISADSLTYDITPATPQNLVATLGQSTDIQQTSSPAISVWHGPIQPLNIQPSDRSPVIQRIPTTEPVVFVGIDDGWVQTPENLEWLTQHHLPFTLFLTNNGVKNNYGYFKELQNAGMTIQNHTLSHPNLAKLNIDQQKTEICGTADTYQSVYGQRPTLFRPPYGSFNDNTLRAAAECGMKAVVMWHVIVGTGGDVQFQNSNNHLQPGDIVLMHFRPEFLSDMQAFAKQAEDNHLQVARLEDWIH